MKISARKAMLACLLSIFGANQVWAHDHENHGQGAEGLGKVVFPTSCSAKVQATFETGVALLHSFEYDRATKSFQDVADQDPDCAIAYWGLAMGLYHQLWGEPSAKDLANGWLFMQKAQHAREQSPREAAWIAALSTFYKPGSRKVERRTAQYSQAMKQLHAAEPADDEAAVFYALSLLAAQPPTDTSLLHSKNAVAILNEVLARTPDHPGVAHYLIHACDSPALAPQGLAAARRYAAIASSSPHAVHMPSHIFARLGLWKEDIASNLAAKAVSERQSEAAFYALHPMDFLEYAYLQTGQSDKARTIAQEGVAVPMSSYGNNSQVAEIYDYYQNEFPAMLVLENKDWDAALAMKPAGTGPTSRMKTYWVQAVAAGHLRDVNAAKTAVAGFEQALAEHRKAHSDRPIPPVESSKNEARAWLAYAQGNSKLAFELMNAVVKYQDKVGKGEVELPAREMLADMLLDLDRLNEALQQYAASLKTDPNRFNGLYGAGRAAEQLGQAETANGYYQQLLANCEPSESPGRKELVHAREFVASHHQVSSN